MRHRRHRPSTGIVIAHNAPQSSELTFPADLIKPPQSQVVQYADAVADRVAQLDAAAQRLAEGFGIPFTTFVLNPSKYEDATDNLRLVAATLEAFTRREERISLERRSGRWGLYYSRTPAVLDQTRTTEITPLRDASLDVRERFLARSEDFIREYLNLCEDRLGKMKSSVDAANRTIDLLANLQLK